MEEFAVSLRASGVALVAAILASVGIAVRAAPTSPPAGALETVTYCYGLHPYCFELDAVLQFRPSALVFPAQAPDAAGAAQTVTLVNISDRPLYLSRFEIT